jgi:hypothetical protein
LLTNESKNYGIGLFQKIKTMIKIKQKVKIKHPLKMKKKNLRKNHFEKLVYEDF